MVVGRGRSETGMEVVGENVDEGRSGGGGPGEDWHILRR